MSEVNDVYKQTKIIETTVLDIYGKPIWELKAPSGLEFIDFRPVKKGESYLTMDNNIEGRTINNYESGKFIRLILGPKSKVVKHVFTELGPSRPIMPGELYAYDGLPLGTSSKASHHTRYSYPPLKYERIEE